MVLSQICSQLHLGVVPQGSILGPLLFLIYIDDIAADLSSKVALFADDCILFRSIRSLEDQYLLQQDLDRLVSWSRKWQMNFSPDKCEVLSIGLVKKPLVTSYFLNEHELKKVDEHKHLGITITSTLNWSAHTERMAAKAWKVWGVIKRMTRGAKMTAGLQLYKSLVVPILEYASPV